MLNIYGQILNLTPHKLASVDSIYLLGTINCAHMGENSTENAMYPLFKHIENTNQKLLPLGYKIEIAYFAGDTPICQSICGLVESVGNANFPCRQCLIFKTDLFKIYKHCECDLRTKNGSYTLANELQKIDKKGVIKTPNFWQFDTFDAIQQTPMDGMHILPEGICRKQVMEIFRLWIDTKRTDVEELNRCIANFNYQYLYVKNKVPFFTRYDMEKNDLIISASQMITLVLLFPFIFEKIIDINHTEYKYFVAYYLYGY